MEERGAGCFRGRITLLILDLSLGKNSEILNKFQVREREEINVDFPKFTVNIADVNYFRKFATTRQVWKELRRYPEP